MKWNKIETALGAALVVLILCLTLQLHMESSSLKSQKNLQGTNTYKEKILTEESGALPSAYDLRDAGKQPTLKNQGSLNTCWAVAASSALESCLLPNESVVFSADHLSLQNAFSKSQNDGGDYSMIMAYLAAWQGPVTEEMDPYGDGESPDGLSPAKHVQEMQLMGEKDYDAIKAAVYRYGAVQSSIYMDMQNAFSSSVYYNQLNFSYYYSGEEKANHDILIIGWDDQYPAENFNVDTAQNGAFLCQNSWGSDFGDNGIFYVSYEDINIGKNSIVYTGIEEADNYDAIYQTDLCGWVGQLGYGDGTCYFANIFEAEQDEVIRAVGFYATGAETQYSITIMDGEADLSNSLLETPAAEGYLENAGFYTIVLDDEVQMEAGGSYAVVVKIHTADTQYPVATEYAADDSTANVDISDGDGYISHNGAIWTGTESEYGCNVCMKLYTDRS